MSYHDYQIGLLVATEYQVDDYFGLIQSAMRLSPTDEDLAKLVSVYPDVWEELKRRYNCYHTNGKLPEEINPIKEPCDNT